MDKYNNGMENFFYRVVKGDSIAALSSRFNLPQTLIIKDNNLSREVSEGDVVFIRAQAGRTYRVQPFDTVESVAARFNVDAETLAETNGVDYLFYGLTLIIPESDL
ncbi:MAG: LysM peptidoglycan-binding domain-containing protein [Clostridia bacterium]|nr:LysM peptidoglycan-binding domain-containing protein [Clostridia bacterium]